MRVVGHGTSAMGGTVRGTVPGAPGEVTPRLSVRWGLPRGVWFSAHRGQVLHRDGENVVAFDAWPGQAPLAPRGRAVNNHIIQAKRSFHLKQETCLLAVAVEQVKFPFREQNRHGNAR